MACAKNKNQGCQRPQDLKGKPENCSPEQVRTCHGDAKGHTCCKPKKA